MTFDDLRMTLADARMTLRAIQDREELARAEAEMRAIEHAGGDSKALGSNEADRKRALTVAVATDPTYLGVLDALRAAQYDVDRAQAAVENAADKRRAEELAIRDRLSDALLTLARIPNTPFLVEDVVR